MVFLVLLSFIDHSLCRGSVGVVVKHKDSELGLLVLNPGFGMYTRSVGLNYLPLLRFFIYKMREIPHRVVVMVK